MGIVVLPTTLQLPSGYGFPSHGPRRRGLDNGWRVRHLDQHVPTG